jgi:hypothetical protein
MRVPEEPVCIDLFRQNPVFTSLHLKSPVLVHHLGKGGILSLRPYLINFDATGSPCHELTSWDNSSSIGIELGRVATASHENSITHRVHINLTNGRPRFSVCFAATGFSDSHWSKIILLWPSGIQQLFVTSDSGTGRTVCSQ